MKQPFMSKSMSHCPFIVRRSESELDMELTFFVESSEQWDRLNYFLVGEVRDNTSKLSRFHNMRMLSIPGLELGYASVGISSARYATDRISLDVSGVKLLSSSFAKGDFRAVDAGLGVVVASAIRIAASVHEHVGVKNAWLVMEGNFGHVDTQALILHTDWAEALGLPGEDRDFRLRQVRWSDVSAFDAESAVRALYLRGLKAEADWSRTTHPTPDSGPKSARPE